MGTLRTVIRHRPPTSDNGLERHTD